MKLKRLRDSQVRFLLLPGKRGAWRAKHLHVPQVDGSRGRRLTRPLWCSRHGRGPPCGVPEGRAMRAGWWRSPWSAQGPQAERRPKTCFSLCSGCARQRIERRAWPPGDLKLSFQGPFECVRAGLYTWVFYIWGQGRRHLCSPMSSVIGISRENGAELKRA